MVSQADLRPAAQGVLSKTPLPHLLVYVADRQLRGSLVLYHGEEEQSVIYSVKGHPAKVRSSFPTAHLGRVLMQLGFFDEKTMRETYEMARASGMLHGQLLLQKGIIDQAQLAAGLREQMARRLLRLFEELKDDTRYEFYADVNLIGNWGGPELTPLDVYRIVWQGMNLVPNHPAISHTLGRLGDMRLRPNAEVDWQRFGFNAAQRKLIDAMRVKPMSLDEVIRLGILPTRQTKVLVYVLTITKSLTALPPTVKTAPDPQDAAGIKVSKPPRATTSRAPESSTMPPSSSRGVPMAKLKLQTKAVRKKKETKYSPEELEKWRQEIRQRAQEIAKKDYFQVLGIRREAPIDSARSAYFAMAKRFHPDRLPPELEDVKDEAGRVFARISEAFHTLSNPQKRARYLEAMANDTSTEEGQINFEALEEFGKAKVALKKMNYEAALRHATIAYEARPENCDFAAVYAWALAMQDPHETDERALAEPLRILRNAVDKNDECELGFFYLGMLLKRLGKTAAALKAFNRAVEINPGNIDAKREIRFAHSTTIPAPAQEDSDSKHFDWKNDPVGDLIHKWLKKKK